MTDEFYQMIRGVSEAASQPVCKLIEAVSAGAGMVYQPLHVKRMAAAEVEALVIRAEAELKLTELRQRAAARLTNTESRRQENIESIVESAYENLPGECSEKPVDKDWMADFFDCCKDVGDADVQSLWGKLLAGELAEPNSYSRRALNTLKLMSSIDAGLFTIIGFRVWKLNGWPVLVIPGSTRGSWPQLCPFRWSDISTLADIGLVDPQIHTETDFIRQGPREYTFEYCGQRYIGWSNPLRGQPSWVNFTRLGAELLPLVTQPAGIRDAYFDACYKCFSVPQWRHDETSDFRVLDVPDDLVESLNLNKALDDAQLSAK